MNMFTRSVTFVVAGSLGVAGTASAAITGAGSTFVYPILSRWAADFKKNGGDEINYQSIGSGGGIAQIKAGTVDFGATDKPLPSEELSASGLAQFPVVIGGVVPVINIPGARPGQVKMSGAVLAGIYSGDIKSWNDPAIAIAWPMRGEPSLSTLDRDAKSADAQIDLLPVMPKSGR